MPRRRRFYVYVIELSDEAGTRLDPRHPNVYVGSTGKTPEERFADHKAGGIYARPKVRDYGLGLLPELYESLNPFPSRDEAEAAERALASELRDMGYRVHGGQGRPVKID